MMGKTCDRGALASMLALSFGTLLLLCGCATSVIADRSSEPAWSYDVAAPSVAVQDPIVLEESGWWAKDSYVHYGLKATNPNHDAYARNARVRVTLFDGAGGVIQEYEDEIAFIGPGETIGFAGECGTGLAPSSVSIEILEGSAEFYDASQYRPMFSLVGYEEQDKLYYRYEVTGSIENLTPSYVGTVRLSVLMLDEEGAIVAGYSGEAYKIKSGQVKDFLLTMNTAPDHASVEVWAQPEG